MARNRHARGARDCIAIQLEFGDHGRGEGLIPDQEMSGYFELKSLLFRERRCIRPSDLMAVLGIEVEATVYFAEDPAMPRGWLEYMRLALGGS
jgi:hypothetical protein